MIFKKPYIGLITRPEQDQLLQNFRFFHSFDPGKKKNIEPDLTFGAHNLMLHCAKLTIRPVKLLHGCPDMSLLCSGVVYLMDQLLPLSLVCSI